MQKVTVSLDERIMDTTNKNTIASTNRIVFLSMLITVLIVGMSFIAAPAAAQESSVQEDSVDINGSTITLELADGATAAGVGSFNPEDVEISDVSDNGENQPQDGVVWRDPSGDTVSFTLTPTSDQEVGDTITFSVYNGSAETTVTVEVVEEISTPVSPINENNVSTTGSTITVNLAEDASSAAVSSLPDNADVSNIGAGGEQLDGGIVWNNPSGDTVNFTLTPSADQKVGDTVSFSVFDGSETTTASVEIIRPVAPDDFPGSEGAFRAIDSDNSGAPFGSIEIARALRNNGNFEAYPNVEIRPITFAKIIVWNREQVS